MFLLTATRCNRSDHPYLDAESIPLPRNFANTVCFQIIRFGLLLDCSFCCLLASSAGRAGCGPDSTLADKNVRKNMRGVAQLRAFESQAPKPAPDYGLALCIYNKGCGQPGKAGQHHNHHRVILDLRLRSRPLWIPSTPSIAVSLRMQRLTKSLGSWNLSIHINKLNPRHAGFA